MHQEIATGSADKVNTSHSFLSDTVCKPDPALRAQSSPGHRDFMSTLTAFARYYHKDNSTTEKQDSQLIEIHDYVLNALATHRAGRVMRLLHLRSTAAAAALVYTAAQSARSIS